MKKIFFLAMLAILLLGFSGCSNHTSDYREGSIHPAVARPVRTREIRRAPPEISRPVEQQSAHRSVQHYTPRPYMPSHKTMVEPKPTTEPITESTTTPTHNPPPAVLVVPPEARPSTIKNVLGTHTTEFNAKEENRVTNITKASDSINGHVVQAGATFSYNQTVGPTNERRGYKKGIIFVDGEKEEGFGGGVCQVSTTLAIAAENAGMTITERHDHSRPVSYAGEGDEAATSYGGIDFKFKNEKTFPVVINSTVQGGMISIDIREAG